MKNDSFNTPLIGERELMNKKKNLANKFDQLKKEGLIPYQKYSLAIMGIHYAESIGELNKIKRMYRPLNY